MALPSCRCWFLFFIAIIGGFATATIEPYEGAIRALKRIAAANMIGKELLLPNNDEDDDDSGDSEDVGSSSMQSDIIRKLQVPYSLRIWTPLFIDLMILFNVMRTLKRSPVKRSSVIE